MADAQQSQPAPAVKGHVLTLEFDPLAVHLIAMSGAK
jgi:hypothetical protein